MTQLYNHLKCNQQNFQASLLLKSSSNTFLVMQHVTSEEYAKINCWLTIGSSMKGENFPWIILPTCYNRWAQSAPNKYLMLFSMFDIKVIDFVQGLKNKFSLLAKKNSVLSLKLLAQKVKTWRQPWLVFQPWIYV